MRDATETDLEMIRRWRNHPKVRSASIFVDPITPEGHARWWSQVSGDPSKRVLIYSYHDVACGVILINDHDPVAGTAEWGFFLDVDGLTARGQLVPAWLQLEAEAVRYGFDDLGLAVMGGRTLAWNKPVLALHHRLGFVDVPARGYEVAIDGRDQAVVWTELTADRHRAWAMEGPRALEGP